MARLPRLTLAGYPHHIIQRGNNRQVVFANAGDFQTFLDLLVQQASTCRVAVHAYVLMDNHFHLLVTPQTDEGVPRMMQALGRAYVRYFNDTHQRSGTLWEGRYKSTVVQSERYLLAHTRTLGRVAAITPVPASTKSSPPIHCGGNWVTRHLHARPPTRRWCKRVLMMPSKRV